MAGSLEPSVLRDWQASHDGGEVCGMGAQGRRSELTGLSGLLVLRERHVELYSFIRPHLQMTFSEGKYGGKRKWIVYVLDRLPLESPAIQWQAICGVSCGFFFERMALFIPTTLPWLMVDDARVTGWRRSHTVLLLETEPLWLEAEPHCTDRCESQRTQTG